MRIKVHHILQKESIFAFSKEVEEYQYRTWLSNSIEFCWTSSGNTVQMLQNITPLPPTTHPTRFDNNSFPLLSSYLSKWRKLLSWFSSHISHRYSLFFRHSDENCDSFDSILDARLSHINVHADLSIFRSRYSIIKVKAEKVKERPYFMKLFCYYWIKISLIA